MSKNVAIGILVALILAGGGYALYQQRESNGDSETATTTASGSENTAGAGNSGGTTPPPAPSPTPVADVPTVRTDASVVPSSSTAVVTGTVDPNGAATTYWYEYGETTALGTRTSAQTLGSGTNPINAPALLTGLRQNTLYHFRLSAQNRLGTVNGTTYDFRTTTTPPPTGTAPTTRTSAATDISRTTANLHGQVNPNGSATTFWFEYGESQDLGRITSLQSLAAGSSLTNIDVSLSNLNPLTRYYFRLNAQNQYGTVNGSILSFTTVGPAAPGAPTVDTTAATNVATSSVTLDRKSVV